MQMTIQQRQPTPRLRSSDILLLIFFWFGFVLATHDLTAAIIATLAVIVMVLA